MRNRVSVFAWVVLLAGAGVVGCKGARDPAPEERAAESSRKEPADADVNDGAKKSGDADEVRVAPDMLRDLRVTTQKAEARAAGEGVTLLGELRVNEDAYAEVACPISARISKVSVALGDAVKPGQVLAEVESAEIGRARAELLNTRARSELARAVVERKRGLAADNVVPARELQEAEMESKSADAALMAARGTLLAFGVASGDVDKTTDAGSSIALRAPIAGTVIERNAVRGARVDADKTLFRVADEKRLWLVVHAFERDAVRITAGAVARVSFPALPGKTFSGKVTNVGREVEAASRTIPIRVDVENDGGELRTGMSASAWVPLGDGGASVVAVPLMALQRLDRDWVVFVPKGSKDDGVFTVKKLGRGRDLGADVEILSGLSAGDEVVVDGAFLLKAEAEKARGGGGDED